MSKVIVSGFIKIPAQSINELRVGLAEHADLSRTEPGCLIFKLTENESEPGRFDLYEEYVDEAAFEAHKQRTAASAWGSVGQDIERHLKIDKS